jgi:hypothetical protein
MTKRMRMTARLMSAPRFFFSLIQELFQKPTGRPTTRSLSCVETSADSKWSGVSLR